MLALNEQETTFQEEKVAEALLKSEKIRFF